jgi:hypothetical protein
MAGPDWPVKSRRIIKRASGTDEAFEKAIREGLNWYN